MHIPGVVAAVCARISVGGVTTLLAQWSWGLGDKEDWGLRRSTGTTGMWLERDANGEELHRSWSTSPGGQAHRGPLPRQPSSKQAVTRVPPGGAPSEARPPRRSPVPSAPRPGAAGSGASLGKPRDCKRRRQVGRLHPSSLWLGRRPELFPRLGRVWSQRPGLGESLYTTSTAPEFCQAGGGLGERA